MRRWIAGAAVAAAAAAFWLRSGGEPYPPKYNADGTVDYTLMAGEPGGYSRWWILRFPQSIAVEPSKPLSGTFAIPGSGTTTIRTGYNEELMLFFRLPGLEPWPADTEGDALSSLSLSVRALPGFDQKTVELLDAEREVNCQAPVEIAPGLLMFDGDGEDSRCFARDSSRTDWVGYVLRPENGVMMAEFECPKEDRGADALNGGDGTDVADYRGAASGIVADLVSGGTGGEAAGDSYAGVEYLYGSDFADAIAGDAQANRLTGKYKNEVYVLPKHLDEKVAKLHLEKLGMKLTELKPEQAAYIGVTPQGPFKGDMYRY